MHASMSSSVSCAPYERGQIRAMPVWVWVCGCVDFCACVVQITISAAFALPCYHPGKFGAIGERAPLLPPRKFGLATRRRCLEAKNMVAAFADLSCPCCNNPWSRAPEAEFSLSCGACVEDDGGVTGIDPKNLDASVNPSADFYTHANGTWLANNPIPGEYPSWNTFVQLHDQNLPRLRGLLEALKPPAAGAAAGSTEAKVAAFWSSSIDEAAIEAAGLTPLAALFAACDLAQTDRTAAVAKLHAEFGRRHRARTPRRAGRVPGRSATHACALHLGQASTSSSRWARGRTTSARSRRCSSCTRAASACPTATTTSTRIRRPSAICTPHTSPRCSACWELILSLTLTLTLTLTPTLTLTLTLTLTNPNPNPNPNPDPNPNQVLGLLGDETEAAGRGAEAVLRLETALAAAHLTRTEARDPETTYNKMSPAKLAAQCKGGAAGGIDWPRCLELIVEPSPKPACYLVITPSQGTSSSSASRAPRLHVT